MNFRKIDPLIDTRFGCACPNPIKYTANNLERMSAHGHHRKALSTV
jgi:hypothetical protein